MTRPAKLQINQRGAWRDVLRFDVDAMNDKRMYIFLTAAADMARAIGQTATTMRVVSDEATPKRVLSWTAERGWKPNGNTACAAPDQSQRVPEPQAGASGPAAAENGSKAPESKGA